MAIFGTFGARAISGVGGYLVICGDLLFRISLPPTGAGILSPMPHCPEASFTSTRTACMTMSEISSITCSGPCLSPMTKGHIFWHLRVLDLSGISILPPFSLAGSISRWRVVNLASSLNVLTNQNFAVKTLRDRPGLGALARAFRRFPYI